MSKYGQFMLLALLMGGVHKTQAQNTLPTVTVTATQPAITDDEAAAHTTIIHAKDIEKSTATTLAELLRIEGNLSLLSYFGNGKNAATDMRGMGVSAGSNVLVVVDGVRMNAQDLSGPDLSILSLAEIERIEIVRGGGSVRYGSGAVGGVIRITTRRHLPAGGKQAKLQLQAGSDGRKAWRLNGAVSGQELAATVYLNQDQSEGYRDNGELNVSAAGLSLKWSKTLGSAITDVYLKASVQRDQYGLPGPVSLAAFQGTSQDRQSTQYPSDGGETLGRRYELGATMDWGRQGVLAWRSSLHQRANGYLIGVNNELSTSEQQNLILSDQWHHALSYDFDSAWMGWKQSTTLGWDAMAGSYERWENGLNVPRGQKLIGQTTGQALFGQTNLYPNQQLKLHAGVRWNKTSVEQANQTYRSNCTFNDDPIPVVNACSPYAYLPTGVTTDADWTNKAAELGATWQVSKRWQITANASRNFRVPNIDELSLADASLVPQQGINRELGLRYALGKKAAWSATLFALENDAEIYYGVDESGLNAVNRNRTSRTLRKGIEIDMHWQVSQQWRWRGQASYLSPRLEGSDVDIPLVARTTASWELAWQLQKDWSLTLNGQYVGARPDGNADNDPTLPQVASYQVWDMGLRYKRRSALLKLGIQNMFGEIYSTQVYSQSYYPMPERSAYLMLDFSL